MIAVYVKPTSKTDENSNWKVVAVHFSSPYNEVTNKQLRGRCKECNKKHKFKARKLYQYLMDQFFKGALGKSITTKFF